MEKLNNALNIWNTVNSILKCLPFFVQNLALISMLCEAILKLRFAIDTLLFDIVIVGIIESRRNKRYFQIGEESERKALHRLHLQQAIN